MVTRFKILPVLVFLTGCALSPEPMDLPAQSKSARAMADFVGRREKQGMIALGVDNGLYQLKNVSMDEHVLNGKTFYTMSYQTASNRGPGYETASLYLYFPKITGNTDYILAHFSQTYVDSEPTGPSCRMGFNRILENLTIK